MRTLILVALLLSFTFKSWSQVYCISNVSVITMESEKILANQNVVIENGIIKAIGPKVKAPANATIIDGKGKYLIPGLFDMHAHFFYEQVEGEVNTIEEELKLMLANGLTTVRITNGDSIYLEARKKVNANNCLGPTLFITSPQLVGSWPWGGKVFGAICDTPEKGSAAVTKFKNLGYDAIKITFMVKADVYDAIVKTAAKENIKVMGHVGPLVKLPKALAAKQQIEHMDEFIDMLLPDTSYNHGQSVSDMNLWRRRAWETVPHLDESRIYSLVQSVKDAGIYVTPTNHFFYSFFATGIDKEKVIASESFKYVPSKLNDTAWKVRDQYWNRAPSKESRDKYIYLRNKMIRELWLAKVPLMAGSDSPQWFSMSGFALHDEIENLVQVAGLTPYAALETATINPANYLGVGNKKGTIVVGKDADLVLLNANPLENIGNTRKIHSVFRGSSYYSDEKIKTLLEEAMVLSK